MYQSLQPYQDSMIIIWDDALPRGGMEGAVVIRMDKKSSAKWTHVASKQWNFPRALQMMALKQDRMINVHRVNLVLFGSVDEYKHWIIHRLLWLGIR